MNKIIVGDKEYFCQDNETVLDALERFDDNNLFIGCRKGGCGACKIEILEGKYKLNKMNREHISIQEEENNIVLACCVRPIGNLKIKIL